MHVICKEHKSHANYTHPVDVHIERPSFFHNVLKKGNESQNTSLRELDRVQVSPYLGSKQLLALSPRSI